MIFLLLRIYIFFAALTKSEQTIVILVDYMRDERFIELDAIGTMKEVTEIWKTAFLGLFQDHEQRIALTFLTHGFGSVIAANIGMEIRRTRENDVYVKYIFGEFELKQSFSGENKFLQFC